MHCDRKSSSVTGCDEPSGEDEVFFGPIGHTERCVSKAVEDVYREEEKVKVATSLLLIVRKCARQPSLSLVLERLFWLKLERVLQFCLQWFEEKN